MSIIKQIEQSPEWLLVSESENTKAFYSIERGMYLVAFLSTGDYCMFDEYQGLTMSNCILCSLLGARPEETKEAPIIDSFMTDLEAEYNTIAELYDNLVRIASLLGRK